jgi:DNA-binding transcriptional MerR regulator
LVRDQRGIDEQQTNNSDEQRLARTPPRRSTGLDGTDRPTDGTADRREAERTNSLLDRGNRRGVLVELEGQAFLAIANVDVGHPGQPLHRVLDLQRARRAVHAPARTEGNYRAYTSAHLGRLSFIRRTRDLGFSLDQVRELLELADDRSRPCGAIDAIASAHRSEVERKIRDLQALKAELDSLIDQCSRGTIAQCRIIEALSPLGD